MHITKPDKILILSYTIKENNMNKTSEKRYNLKYNVGTIKYLVSYHNGVKKHSDGSDFFDVKIFKNKKKLKIFTDDLRNNRYIEE